MQKEVSAEDIYQVVKTFKDNLETKSFNEMFNEEINKNEVLLSSIINLHNKEGICCLKKIIKMIDYIKKGGNIFEDRKWPNIKLAKMEGGKLVLFDGHHSLLSYMAARRKYLWEIPHLLVSNENSNAENDWTTDSEIKVVFGNLDGNWKKEVVNWQASPGEQLCIRREKNMGELFTSLHADICLHNE